MQAIFALLYTFFVLLNQGLSGSLIDLLGNNNCNERHVTVLQVTKTPKNVSVSCSGRPRTSNKSLTTEKPYVKLHATWRSGIRDYFTIEDSGELQYEREKDGRKDVHTEIGNTSQVTYFHVDDGQTVIGHRAYNDSTARLVLYIIITFNYTVEMDISKFSCRTRCAIGPGIDIYAEKEVELTYPSGKCNYERYQFEYPCKYADYLDLGDAGTCVKIVNSAVSWREAKARCVHRYNGTLIKITSKAMNDAINKLISPSSGGYWIGLSNIWLRHLYNDTFTWLDETQPANYMNRFKTAPGPSDGNEYCVVSIPADYWNKSKCYPNSYKFICEKISAREPGPPSLSFKFFPGHRHAYIGYDFYAQCSAFTELGVTVTFRMSHNNTIMEFDSNYYTSLAEEEFVEVDGRCLSRTRADLKLRGTSELSGAQFKCCWDRQKNRTSCSDSTTAYLRHLPQRPVLTVENSYYLSIGDHVTATCSACVGTGGQLVWALDMLDTNFQWSSHFKSTQNLPRHDGPGINPNTTSFVGDRNVTSIEWSVREDALCGPYIKSTFQRLVEDDLHGAVLICYTSNPDNISVNTEDVTTRSSMFAVHAYSIPIWSILMLLGLFIPLGICVLYGQTFARKKELAHRRSRQKSQTLFRKKPMSELQRRRCQRTLLGHPPSTSTVLGKGAVPLKPPNRLRPLKTQRPPCSDNQIAPSTPEPTSAIARFWSSLIRQITVSDPARSTSSSTSSAQSGEI